MRQGALAVLLGGSLFLAGAADSQEPVAVVASLPEAARRAAGGFRPVAAGDVGQAREEMIAAINALDAFLRTGAPYKSVGWKTYLRWDELTAAVRSGQPAPEVISSVEAKLQANHGGLERPEFTRLRDALHGYVSAAAVTSNSNLANEYCRRMEELAGQLETLSNNRTGESAAAVGRTLGWLEANRQAPELVASIRQAYGRPNFLGRASRSFVAAGVERPVDQLTPVRDNILGTDIHGTARLVGRTTVSLNENPSAASMNILLGGTAWSNNVGYNGPVTIHSTGVTSVSGRKSILMTANGLYGYCAQASCGTRSNIYDICAKCGLIERMAWKRAGQQKGQAEAIASQHASWRVAGQMDREAGGMIAEQNARYYERFRNPLTRRNEFPEELTFSSTRDRVQVRMLQAAPGLLAAPDEPPGFSKEHDLAVRAHESAVVNYAQVTIGGFELTDVRLEKLIRDDLKAELPEELQITRPDGTLDPDKEPWSIIFAKETPVRAKFDGGGVSIAIRADGFTRGEGDEEGKYRPAITELVEIYAAYKVDKTDAGATLRRDGDVQVRFPNRANPEQITVRDSPIVTFIRRKFRSLFKEEFVGEGLVFKGQWARAGRLKLSEIAADQAWLRLGWDMPGTAAAEAGPAATGASGAE
jgi:hypothetical protein